MREKMMAINIGANQSFLSSEERESKARRERKSESFSNFEPI